MQKHAQSTDKAVANIKRLIICSVVLIVGLVGMKTLAKMKKPPTQVDVGEQILRVEVQTVMPQDAPVHISGYGEVRVLDTVGIAPEVAGKVVAVHPRLEVGDIVAQDDLLFEIDSRDYRAAFDEARATSARWRTSIAVLQKQLELDRQRLKTLERNRDLARDEFSRLGQLFENDSVGTRSGVDAAELAYNRANDSVDQMAQALALFPLQIKEARSSLAASSARESLARINLERCRVTAPFRGRVKAVAVEIDQYVTPGQPIVTLANDAALEIWTPLDSRDVRRWLRFQDVADSGDTNWFAGLLPVDCVVCWTEDCETYRWRGRLDRVVQFDPQTRTVTVAVRMAGSAATSHALPLVDGMFCLVAIPGKTLTDVFVLPRWAVSFDNTVYLVNAGRLKTVAVTVARIEADQAIVSAGLQAGDQVITTRLIDPMENALLEIIDTPRPTGDPA